MNTNSKKVKNSEKIHITDFIAYGLAAAGGLILAHFGLRGPSLYIEAILWAVVVMKINLVLLDLKDK